MLIQRENHPPLSPWRQDSPAPTGSDATVAAGQSTLALQVGCESDPGLRRKLSPNEDTLSVTSGVIPSAAQKPFVLLALADGMGGQSHGQEASRLAVQSLCDYLYSSLLSKQMASQAFQPLLKAGVQYANRVLYQRNQERLTVMGTTMTAVLIVDCTGYVAHVGDSRCYLYREPGGLSQITQDHSLVAALAAAGAIQPEDIYTHPRRNLIYRCLGEKASVEVDTSVVALAAEDVLLLCSDGLWEMVRDREIAAILASRPGDPAHTSHVLIQAALSGGGEDNVSVIVARASKA
jgi:serine/threonine protein phosphatase PrpC